MEDWVKKEGQESKQAAIQEEHTNKEYMAAYLKPSDIPLTPKENREQYKAYDDDEIVNIPFVDVCICVVVASSTQTSTFTG